MTVHEETTPPGQEEPTEPSVGSSGLARTHVNIENEEAAQELADRPRGNGDWYPLFLSNASTEEVIGTVDVDDNGLCFMRKGWGNSLKWQTYIYEGELFYRIKTNGDEWVYLTPASSFMKYQLGVYKWWQCRAWKRPNNPDRGYISVYNNCPPDWNPDDHERPLQLYAGGRNQTLRMV
ncbi:hypothetical protein [Streptomyces sp. enrichment culture]|uniref:hypothetical protein n=1 Tax=Streptomyces sp. enrichment culture TaxID=1795815 RepID=UPI003F57D548